MLGVDTNVLIRFLSTDDAVQSPQAQSLLSNPRNHPVYLSMLVLVEAFNVLTRVKKYPAKAVLDSYRMLLETPALVIERSDMVLEAVEQASRSRTGFSDALIALQNLEAGCATTATFDIKALRLDGMSPAKDYA